MSDTLPEVDSLSSELLRSFSISLSIGMNNYGILIVMVVLIMSTLIAGAGQTKFFVVLSQKDSWQNMTVNN